ERVYARLQKGEDVRRSAGNELQVEYALVEIAVKRGPRLHLRLVKIAQNAPVAHSGQLRVIHALKGVHALGAHLAGARTGDDAPVEDHADAVRAAVRGVGEGVQQVFARVAVLCVDGLLRTGDHH